MPKFYRKKYYKSGSKDKYSIETKAGYISTPASSTTGLFQNTITIVPFTAVEGMRKVKHITATLTGSAVDTGFIAWALVYVPEGYTPNTLQFQGGSLYQPAQFVMATGISDYNAGPIRISSPLSHNLNSGDSIWLVVGTAAASQTIGYHVKYAISLQ